MAFWEAARKTLEKHGYIACYFCGRRFKSLEAWRNHMLRHLKTHHGW